MDRARLFSLLIFFLRAVYPTVAQNANVAGTDQHPTFKSNVRVVLVDVVVTDSNDEPVTGLTKNKFQVFEDGKLQKLASFEEHAGIPDVPALSRMGQTSTEHVFERPAGQGWRSGQHPAPRFTEYSDGGPKLCSCPDDQVHQRYSARDAARDLHAE
jgi:hypothetical protein